MIILYFIGLLLLKKCLNSVYAKTSYLPAGILNDKSAFLRSQLSLKSKTNSNKQLIGKLVNHEITQISKNGPFTELTLTIEDREDGSFDPQDWSIQVSTITVYIELNMIVGEPQDISFLCSRTYLILLKQNNFFKLRRIEWKSCYRLDLFGLKFIDRREGDF